MLRNNILLAVICFTVIFSSISLIETVSSNSVRVLDTDEDINLFTKEVVTKRSTKKIKKNFNLTKLDKALQLFVSCIKQIEKINDKNSNKEEALLEFLEIQDEIFKLFDKNSEVEEKMLTFLINFLHSSLNKSNVEKISKQRAFGWG
jgi:hypothetical protein